MVVPNSPVELENEDDDKVLELASVDPWSSCEVDSVVAVESLAFCVVLVIEAEDEVSLVALPENEMLDAVAIVSVDREEELVAVVEKEVL